METIAYNQHICIKNKYKNIMYNRGNIGKLLQGLIWGDDQTILYFCIILDYLCFLFFICWSGPIALRQDVGLSESVRSSFRFKERVLWANSFGIILTIQILNIKPDMVCQVFKTETSTHVLFVYQDIIL